MNTWRNKVRDMNLHLMKRKLLLKNIVKAIISNDMEIQTIMQKLCISEVIQSIQFISNGTKKEIY